MAKLLALSAVALMLAQACTENVCPQGTKGRKGTCYLPAPDGFDGSFAWPPDGGAGPNDDTTAEADAARDAGDPGDRPRGDVHGAPDAAADGTSASPDGQTAADAVRPAPDGAPAAEVEPARPDGQSEFGE